MSDRPLFDPQFFRMRELALTQAVHAVSRERRPVDLFAWPSVEPPPAELRVIRECHARAAALGLTLPRYPRLTVEFVRAPEDASIGGQTYQQEDGTIAIAFAAGQPLDGLRLVALHEYRHAWQFALDVRLSPAALEEDAEMFAWNAMEGWTR